ncbi:MAG TPA: dihydrofolate reductase family protein [Ktedonobacterales bacterium]|nr:dihydrofolate reductase family protein [Ktedonobacterales bacterium]
MNTLQPLEALYTTTRGPALPLPPELAALYGRLEFPPHPGRPYVIGNFVSSLDGVVALNVPGAITGGGEISGFNEHDRLVMGLLRAIADAVIVGAGTLRSVPNHRWTALHIYPPLLRAYEQLRASLGIVEPPLNVIVTAQGAVNLALPVFQSGEVPVLIVTTRAGAERLRQQAIPSWVQMSSTEDEHTLSVQAILEAVNRVRDCDLILTEGGPKLMSAFFAEGLLDELFLTLAPQVAGRDNTAERPGFVDGQRFAPEQPIWGTLVDLKRGSSHLFLRYAFAGDR